MAGIVATLTAVGGLYWLGRSTDPIEEEPDAPLDGNAGPNLLSEGFDYTVSDGSRPIFRVQGGRVLEEQTGAVELEDVGITLHRPTGEVFELQGKSARYDRTVNAARVEGGVVLSGPNGFRLQTEAIELAPGGRRLSTERKVTFQWGADYRGQAAALRADLTSDSFVLSGDVRIVRQQVGGEPFELTARRVLFERPSGTLHAEGEAKLVQGRNVLNAGRLAAQIGPETQQLDFVRARFGVRGRVVDAERLDDTFRYEASEASLLLVDGNPTSLELEGTEGEPARLTARSPEGVRVLIAPYLVAKLENSQVRTLEALQGARLEDRPSEEGEPTRRASARRVEVVFEQGQVKAATLQKGVVLIEGQRNLRAETASLDIPTGRADFFGNPAIATTERGELRAPKISYNRQNGLLQASDGVQGVLTESAGRGLSDLGLGGAGAVQVAAKEASLRDPGGHFSFVGAVRAWRGNNVLVADQLRGDEVGGPITASGGVKTMWRPVASAGFPAEPIEITAGTLIYDAAQGLATYSESVVAKQASQSLICDQAIVRLDATKKAREVDCQGKVRLTDDAASRRVEGDRAIYDLTARTVVIHGQPVVLTDPQRGRAEGRRVVYDMAAGRMRLLATDEDPAP